MINCKLQATIRKLVHGGVAELLRLAAPASLQRTPEFGLWLLPAQPLTLGYSLAKALTTVNR